VALKTLPMIANTLYVLENDVFIGVVAFL